MICFLLKIATKIYANRTKKRANRQIYPFLFSQRIGLGQEFADTFGHLQRRETEFFVEHFVWCREAKRFEAVNNAIGADESFEIDRQAGSQAKFFDTAR